MKPRQLRKLLESRGFELVRTKRHHVFRHQDSGETIVTSSSQLDGDPRLDRRVRSMLRRLDERSEDD